MGGLEGCWAAGWRLPRGVLAARGGQGPSPLPTGQAENSGFLAQSPENRPRSGQEPGERIYQGRPRSHFLLIVCSLTAQEACRTTPRHLRTNPKSWPAPPPLAVPPSTLLLPLWLSPSPAHLRTMWNPLLQTFTSSAYRLGRYWLPDLPQAAHQLTLCLITPRALATGPSRPVSSRGPWSSVLPHNRDKWHRAQSAGWASHPFWAFKDGSLGQNVRRWCDADSQERGASFPPQDPELGCPASLPCRPAPPPLAATSQLHTSFRPLLWFVLAPEPEPVWPATNLTSSIEIGLMLGASGFVNFRFYLSTGPAEECTPLATPQLWC